MRLLIILLFCSLRCFADYDIPTLGETKAGMEGRVYLTHLEKICMGGKNQKIIATPEESLYMECEPWKSRSCCTRETAESIHVDPFEFTLNPCEKYYPLSKECRKHFQRNFCFYECSANVGPWISSISQARFYKVPLCKDDCDNWYWDCVNDYTCFDKWIYGDVILMSSVKSCERSDCIKFGKMYHSPKNMCEIIWDHSWEYINNDKLCMNIWFDTSYNANERVTQMKIMELLQEYDKPLSPKEDTLQPLKMHSNPKKPPEKKVKPIISRNNNHITNSSDATKIDEQRTTTTNHKFGKLIILFVVILIMAVITICLLLYKYDRPNFDRIVNNYRLVHT